MPAHQNTKRLCLLVWGSGRLKLVGEYGMTDTSGGSGSSPSAGRVELPASQACRVHRAGAPAGAGQGLADC